MGQLLAEHHRPRNPLERLVKRNADRQSITQQVRAVLPAALAPHCRVAEVRDQRLLIHMANAAWATRARLELPKIEPALRSLADFAAVRDIRIRTASY